MTRASQPVAPVGPGAGPQNVVQPLGNIFVSPGQAAWGVQFLIPGVYSFTLISPVTGNPEQFLLQIPDIPPYQEAPLLVGFHAFGHSHNDLLQNTNFFTEADNRDWYMLAPLGLHALDFNPATNTWKNNFGSPSSQENTRTAINWVLDNFAVERERIYGVGFSMGAGGMTSYAARHLDPSEGMFAAIVNHTGGVSLRDTYVESPLTRPILEFVYGDAPSNAQFEYRQCSTIEIVAGALTNNGSDMARNLAHIPVNTTYALLKGATTQYLSNQSGLFHGHLTTAVGNLNATETAVGGGALTHTWGTLDEATACDYLQQFTLTIPDSSSLVVDRDGKWFHFDVTQTAPGAFTLIDWEKFVGSNQLDLFANSNLDTVTVDTLELGLDPTQDLIVRVASGDSSEHDLVLSGYAEAPVRVEFDGFRVCRAAPGDTTGWSYSSASQELTLPRDLLTWGNAIHQWDIRSVAIDTVQSLVVVTPGTDIVANGLDFADITITIRDTNGLPVCGFEVIVNSDDPGDLITQPADRTDAAGITTATIASTSAGLKTLTIDVVKGPLTIALADQPTVNFIGDVSALSGALSFGVPSPAVDVVADGVTTSAVTITVTDINGNPIPGQTVSMASDGSNDTIVQSAGPTDASGEAVALLSSTTAELKTLTFTIDPGGLDIEVVANPTVQFIGDANAMDAALSGASVSAPLGVVANGIDTSTVSVTVLDVNSNPVPGRTIQVASSGTNNTLSVPSGLTDALGQATLTIASTRAELKTLTVTIDPGGVALVLNDQPTVEFSADVSNLSAVLSTAIATPSVDVVADDVQTSVISIQILDVNSNPVPGLTAEVASDGSNNTIQQPAVTDLLGMASATLRTPTAELKTVTVTIDPLGAALVVSIQPTIQFIGDAANVSASLSTAMASPTALIAANGLATSTVTFHVRDVNGNDVPAVDVEISSDGTGNLFTQAVGSTDALGGGSGAIATTNAGLKTITVTADPSGTAVPLTQQPTVLFDPDIDALLSTAVAVPATDVVADGVTTADIVVTVLDSFGAPLAGQTVEIAATGTNNTVVQAPAVTDGVGQATATVATTLAEMKTISVTINPLGTPVALAMQPTVQFIGDAANISPTLSSASANPAGLIVADGNAVSTVTVTLKDINDNVVPNASVEIASDGTGNVLAQPAAATDVSGVTTATIATTFAELKTITVTGEPLGAAVVLGDQPTVLFDPDVSATLSTILAAPRIGVVADGIALSTLTITVVDSTGTPMPGQIVEIASDGTNNTIVQPPTATDVAGQAIATIASTTAELKVISITVNSAGTPVVLTTQPTVEFIGDAANISAALSEVVALPAIDVVANGIATSDVTITLKDINDNRVPGVTVELASDGTSNTITQRTGPTSTAGIAVAMVASTKAELKTFTITADPTGAAVILTTQPTAQFIGDAANVSSVLSTVMASPTLDVVANGVDASTVTVVLKDINDNLVPAAEVVLSADGTGNVYTQPVGGTDVAGGAIALLASTAAEQKTVTITVEPSGNLVILSGQPTVDFIPDSSSISASLSTAVANPNTDIIANGVFSSLITITIRDVNGNPIPNVDVDVSSTGTGNVITQPTAPTDAAGETTASMVTTAPELKTLSFNADPLGQAVILDIHPTITFIPNISPSLSSALVVPRADVVADGVQTALITVTVIDSFGAPALGQNVTVTSSGTGNVITQPAATTDVFGQTTATIAATIAELKSLTFVVNGLDTDLELDTHPTVTFIGDATNISNSLSTIVVTPSFGALANGVDTITGLVTARDVNGNAVEGQTVLLLAGGDGNTLVQPVALTDANGEASGTLSSVTAEEKLFTARINPGPQGVALSGLHTVEFIWPYTGARYVRVGGSDAATGESPASAWATLGMAASTATLGQTVYVGAGTYQEAITLATNGTALSRIRFIADTSGSFTSDAGTVLIDAAGASAAITIDADYITIDGFSVTGASPGLGTGGGVLITSNALDTVVRHCKLYSNERGIHCTATYGVTVESNSISNNFAGDGIGLWIDAATNVLAINNLIYNHAGVGVVISGGASSIDVHSCTYFANGGDQVFVTGSGTSADLKHCVMADGLADGIEVSGGATATSSFNLVWNHVGLDWVGLTMGAGDAVGDPLFINPFGGDFLLGGANAGDDAFQLTLGSPAINGGASSADQVILSTGSSMAECTTRLDGVLDGTNPDGSTLNLGFHYGAQTQPLEVLDSNDGRLFYGRTTELQLGSRAWDESATAWLSPKMTMPANRRVRWVVNHVSPLANNEEILAVLCDTGTAADLEVLSWTGVEWRKDLSLLALPAADDRNFDLEFENDSSQGMLVYSDGSSTPLFRTRDAGTWSQPASLPLNDGAGMNPDLNNGVVEWIELVTRPNSDEITCFYTDSDENLVAIVWDGGLWRTLTAKNLDTNVKINSSSGAIENRAFDAAYESSGDLIVAWARQAVNGFYWSLKPVNTATWTAAALETIVMKPHFIDLAAEPGGDRIACGLYDLGDTIERMAVSMWNGATWVNSGELDSQTWDVNDTSLGDFQGGVGWVGTSGTAICVYADEQPGALDWARWTAGSGWVLQPDIPISGKGHTESVQLESVPGANRLQAVFSDETGKLWGASYNGIGWTLANSGTPLEAVLSSIDSKPFTLSFR